MPATSTIPCLISPEAAAHIKDLGIQSEFERMFEHTLATIPDLRRVEVKLDPPSEDDDESRVVIVSYLPALGKGPHPAMTDWRQWVVNTFSPDVWRHVAMITLFEAVDGR
jgi:hypothetical protein